MCSFVRPERCNNFYKCLPAVAEYHMAAVRHTNPTYILTYMQFDEFYISWYSRAKRFARHYVLTDADAENMVQDVFLQLYEHWSALADAMNITAYLFTSLRNRCLNALRQQLKEQREHEQYCTEEVLMMQVRYGSLESMDTAFRDETDITERIRQAVDTLPEQCRRVFVMHKLEGRCNKDVARELGITVNTVETQMKIAYRKLRCELRDCLPLLLLLV